MTVAPTDGTFEAQSDLPFVETWDVDLVSTNPLSFPGYRPPAAAGESVRTGLVELDGVTAVGIECRFDLHGGTMGAVAGERIVRAYDGAAERGLHVVALVASGGARLQEGMVSLTQMARTTSAVARHRRRGLMTAAVLRPHTTGGVYASWASLSDVRAAEPGATIGFGGPRVVAQVTGLFPPPTSHTADAAYRDGLVDALVPREHQLDWLAGVLGGATGRLRIACHRPPVTPGTAADGSRTEPRAALAETAYGQVLTARATDRASGLEWAKALTDDWCDLRGSGRIIRAGLATLAGKRVVVVAMDRHAVNDAAARPGPADFRLAQRAIALGGRLGLGIVTLIDTPGAEPGPAAETDGIAGEIARTMLAMAEAPVPTVAVCIGEGGSGGAMALAHADRLLMLEHAVFSVIGPEAGAAILYRDASLAPDLARDLRLRATELLDAGVVDTVLAETGPNVVDRVRYAVLEGLACTPGAGRIERLDLLTATALTDGGGAVVPWPAGLGRTTTSSV